MRVYAELGTFHECRALSDFSKPLSPLYFQRKIKQHLFTANLEIRGPDPELNKGSLTLKVRIYMWGGSVL